MTTTTRGLARVATALALFTASACDSQTEATKVEKKTASLAAKGAGIAKAATDVPGKDAKGDEGAVAVANKDADAGGAVAADGADGGAQPAVADIGVPDCDDYITKYSKCIEEKMEPKMRAPARKALATASSAWRKASVTKSGRSGLGKACNNAAAAVKATCGW